MKITSVCKGVKKLEGVSGEIYTDGRVWEVGVSNGRIRLEEVQFSGKKRMKTEDCLRGFKLDEYRIKM